MPDVRSPVVMWLFLAGVSAQIDPEFAVNLTVYHVNPAGAGVLPMNMDTADPSGGLYFWLTQFLLPLECSANPIDWKSSFDCQNPEQVSTDLVVTKVDMLVDSRLSGYAACNLCEGVDPFTKRPCQNGTYVCDACYERTWRGKSECDATRVGQADVREKFQVDPRCGPAFQRECGWIYENETSREVACAGCVALRHRSLKHNGCNVEATLGYCNAEVSRPCGEGARDFECWRESMPRKTGGKWYSTQEAGFCREGQDTPCGWQVLNTSTVHEQCLKESVMDTVETAAPACFSTCGPRNVTSKCWINCFFSTIMGPESHNSTTLAGLPIEHLVSAWERPFLPSAEGGCPKIASDLRPDTKVPPSWLKAQGHIFADAVYQTEMHLV